MRYITIADHLHIPDEIKDGALIIDEQILYIIGNKEQIKNLLLRLYSDVSSDMETDYEILQRISTSAPQYGKMGGKANADAMCALIEMKERIKKQQIQELHEEWNKILEYEMQVHWIWQIYRSLPKDQYTILNCIAEKKMSWKAISKEYGYSRSNIGRIRRAALDGIRLRLMEKMEERAKNEQSNIDGTSDKGSGGEIFRR